jgi:RNA polymerase sigma-70 factor (ECF subfamily)
MEYFGQLYNRYIPLIYGLCLKYLKTTNDAQDAVMEIFSSISHKISNYEVRNFRTWIYSVSKNHCLQILKKQAKEITIDFNTQFMEYDTILHLIEEGREKGIDRLNILNKCLEKLPAPQKISIKKFFFEEMSYLDIVEETEYSLKSVKSYIQNGKRNLKNCIETSK